MRAAQAGFAVAQDSKPQLDFHWPAPTSAALLCCCSGRQHMQQLMRLLTVGVCMHACVIIFLHQCQP